MTQELIQLKRNPLTKECKTHYAMNKTKINCLKIGLVCDKGEYDYSSPQYVTTTRDLATPHFKLI